MSNNGWIKLHRKALDSVVFQDAKLWQLWSYCIMKANRQPNKFLWNGEEITVQKGQFITGRKELAKQLHQNESSVYRRLKILEKLEKVNIKSNNKFSLISVIKYNTYQDTKEQDEQQNEQQVNNKRTTSEQQVNTNKKEKKEEKEKNIFSEDKNFSIFPNYSLEYVNNIASQIGISKDVSESFFHYYNSTGFYRNKQPIIDIRSALLSWNISGKQKGIIQDKPKLEQSSL